MGLFWWHDQLGLIFDELLSCWKLFLLAHHSDWLLGLVSVSSKFKYMYTFLLAVRSDLKWNTLFTLYDFHRYTLFTLYDLHWYTLFTLCDLHWHTLFTLYGFTGTLYLLSMIYTLYYIIIIYICLLLFTHHLLRLFLNRVHKCLARVRVRPVLIWL